MYHYFACKSTSLSIPIPCEKVRGQNNSCVVFAAARVLELIQNGAIGDPRLIYASFTFRLTNLVNIRLQPELGGGALMDVGCYCVNTSRTLAGAEPVTVQARANWGKTGVDEQMVGTLCFADGLLAQFDCALTLDRREFYQVAGPDGHINNWRQRWSSLVDLQAPARLRYPDVFQPSSAFQDLADTLGRTIKNSAGIKAGDVNAYWIAYDLLFCLCEEFVQVGVSVILDLTIGLGVQFRNRQ